MKNLILAGLIMLLPATASAGCGFVRVAPDPWGTAGCHGYINATQGSEAGMWCVRYDRHVVYYGGELGGRSTIEDIRYLWFIVTHRKRCD